MKSLYLVNREGLSAIFPSMVLAPIYALQRRGLDVHLGVLTPVGQLLRRPGRARWREVRAEAADRFGVDITRLPSPPARARRLWSDERVVQNWIGRTVGHDGEPTVIHCRGPRAAILALAAKERFPQLRVLFDMRGVNFAEDLLVRGLPDAGEQAPPPDSSAGQIYEFERRAAVEADGVICVASSVADWLVETLDASRERIRVVLNPVDVNHFERCAADRSAIRAKLGATHRFVVCYCGTLREWQQHERGIELFRLMKDVLPEAFFLGVTTSPDQLRSDLQEAGVAAEDYVVTQASHAEVGSYLAAADLGLITRGLGRPPRLEDRLSCPVKFAEYLASGTPVVIGQAIGDCSEIAAREEVGLVMSPAEREPQRLLVDYAKRISADRAAIGERCQQTARQHHDLNAAADQIRDLYSIMANTPEEATVA